MDLHPSTGSLSISTVTHHHLALGILLLSLSASFKLLWTSYRWHLQPYLISLAHTYSYHTLLRSSHARLSNALLVLGTSSIWYAYSSSHLNCYSYLSSDPLSCTALYIHHYWIGCIAFLGSSAHLSIYFIRDIHPIGTGTSIFLRLISVKHAIISTLSWISLFLGFHTLALYSHNDAVCSLGNPSSQILIQPLLHTSVASSSSISMTLSLLGSLTHLNVSPSAFLSMHAFILGSLSHAGLSHVL